MKKLALAVALCALTSVGAKAADLDDDIGPGDHGAYGYEDPRRADMYGDPRRVPPPPPSYGYRVPPPPPAPYAYRPAPGYAAPPRYVETPPRYAEPERWRHGRDGACTDKEVIRQQLIASGWTDFHDPVVDGQFANIKARRPNGDLYVLRVSRCSGEVVDTQFLDRGRSFGPYAYDDYRPRWRRPFY